MTRKILLPLMIFMFVGVALTVRPVSARPEDTPQAQPLPIHPVFAMLDTNSKNVLESGQPVSTMQTCGQCHDTAYIAGHSQHVDLGQSKVAAPGPWNPLTYRYAQPDASISAGLNNTDWVKANAARLVGGGQAQAAGVEMDCFLCHFSNPNLNARTEVLQAGNFAWANTASLVGTGLVENNANTFTWNKSAFSADGVLLPKSISIQEPSNENCAQCHGAVQTSKEPLALTGCDLNQWQTATSGQVISPAKIANSGMNLANKNSLTRSFDVHAERGLACTDCHYSLNNPSFYQAADSPAYLKFDPRRLDIADYLKKPDHNFARSQSTQDISAAGAKNTVQRCESCHEAKSTHAWLPYTERHLDNMACESCHIPKMYAPALQSTDWTVIKTEKQTASATSPTAGVTACRGVDGTSTSLSDLVTGFTPVLLPRKNVDGTTTLTPYNLITSWYWVAGDKASPVSQTELQAAWTDHGQVAPGILAALDANKNGLLDEAELILDTPAKQAAVAARLSAQGLKAPHIVGEIQPYSINHDVTGAGWATKDCKTCHGDTSLISQPMKLASAAPGGVAPKFVSSSSVITNGTIYTENGALYYRPATQTQNLYVFGHDRIPWVDGFGAFFFVAVLLGVSLHGGLRFYAALKNPRPQPTFKKVYMYSVYERFWHWMQTFAIVLLLFTGLIIHRPDVFGIFSFHYVVVVHNILAALLAINAALSLFYHLVSGNIRQFLPHPYGFFDEAITQAKYYLEGIFKGSEHPFEKVPQKKLNPLQQVTYFGILNVLLPLQIVTGALMWGVQQWPQIAGWLGGLPFLAPFHSLIAWTFGAFIVGHVYLTTTGPEPLTSIKAMLMGWEDVETNESASSEDEIPPSEHNSPDLDLGASVS